jgi:hypothetical protein
MIGVIVRDDQIVDLREARLLDRGGDAVGVAAVEARISVSTRIDSPDGDTNQGRLAAFDVDELDVERLLGLRDGRPGRWRRPRGRQATAERRAWSASISKITAYGVSAFKAGQQPGERKARKDRKAFSCISLRALRALRSNVVFFGRRPVEEGQIASRAGSSWSVRKMWLACGSSTRLAFGMARASVRPFSGGTSWSVSP